jgi:hypothetical protein
VDTSARCNLRDLDPGVSDHSTSQGDPLLANPKIW